MFPESLSKIILLIFLFLTTKEGNELEVCEKNSYCFSTVGIVYKRQSVQSFRSYFSAAVWFE